MKVLLEDVYHVSLSKELQEKSDSLLLLRESTNERNIGTIAHPDFLYTQNGETFLILRSETKLNELVELAQSLQEFFEPIEPYKKILVGLHKCDVFINYVENIPSDSEKTTTESTAAIKHLAFCLKETQHILSRLLTSKKITYDQITIGGKLKLENVQGDLDHEFDRINSLIECGGSKSISSLSGIKAMLSLFQARPNVIIVVQACRDRCMKGCLKDSSFKELESICDTIRTAQGKANLTAETAIEYMMKIKTILRYEKMQPFFSLFQKVTTSSTFHDFVYEQFFKNNESVENHHPCDPVESFHTWHQIISTQLQNEDFGEHVLRELSHAFNCIVPFMDKEQNFQELLDRVVKQNPSNNFLELQTVSDNMHHIKRWSIQAEVGVTNIYFCIYVVLIITMMKKAYLVTYSKVALFMSRISTNKSMYILQTAFPTL